FVFFLAHPELVLRSARRYTFGPDLSTRGRAASQHHGACIRRDAERLLVADMFSGRVTRAVLLIPFLAEVASSSAIASPGFPSVVQQTLHLPREPECTLCHGLGKTGFWTVSTAFGTAMLQYGAIAGDGGTIQAALIQLQVNQSPLISDLV